jgi:sulfofructose kinase
MIDVDVLCIGVTSYDLVFSVDHHPATDEKATAKTFMSCGGGPAANAALTVARLGLKAAFCGYLGNDIFGDLHFREFQASQINTDLLIRGEKATPISTILIKPNGERSLVNYRDSRPLTVDQINSSLLNPKVILFDGHEPEISLHFMQRAKKSNIPTILDAGSVNPGTSLLYNKVDYLVCSEVFAREITREEDPEQALLVLSGKNPNVVLTMGEKGLLWKTSRNNGRLKAFAVNAVDTTGAGDVFHGAFARCIALNKQWQECLNFSSAAAAFSCARFGARTSIPNLAEVNQLIKQQGS